MRSFFAGVLLLFCSVVSQAGVLVVPNSLTSVEGNNDNILPFSIGQLMPSLSSERYQQVYAASQFGSGGFITQIAFRPDTVFGAAFSSTISNIRIDLSTTSHLPDGLSTIFANNVGVDDTMVFAGSLSLSSSFTGPAGGPKAFDIVINLMTPFFYNPSAGNLLLDVRNFSGGTTTSFDAHAAFDSISRVFTLDTNGVGDASGQADTNGLVTQFTISAVPEPGTLSLLSLGALVLVGRRLRRSLA